MGFPRGCGGEDLLLGGLSGPADASAEEAGVSSWPKGWGGRVRPHETPALRHEGTGAHQGTGEGWGWRPPGHDGLAGAWERWAAG